MRRGEKVLEADYDHPPADTVELDYPFRLFACRIASMRLDPPTLDDLTALREADAVDAYALVAALTGERPDVVGRMRWPDVEKVLEQGLSLLPPDLVERFAGAVVEDAPADGGENAAPDPALPETPPETPDEAEGWDEVVDLVDNDTVDDAPLDPSVMAEYI